MNDKEKQIEEMVKVISETWLVDLEGDPHDLSEFLDEVDIERIALELYDAGYRKLSED